MDKDFWLERWNNNEIGFHQASINTHLQRFWPALKVPAKGHVFVPLAGKTLDMLWLAGQGHRVTGIEISELAVQAFFEENGLSPRQSRMGDAIAWQQDEITLICGDFFKLAPRQLGPVDAVFDRASLIALPAEMRPQYAAHLRQLAPIAPVLLVTLDYPQDEMDGPPFSVTPAEVESLYADTHRIEPQEGVDVLAENPRFRDRGLTQLFERVYLLLP